MTTVPRSLCVNHASHATLQMHMVELCDKIWGKCAVFMPLKELWEAYSNHTAHPSSLRQVYISYHFGVPMTLTSDLIFRIFCPQHTLYLILSKVGIANLACA